MRIAPVSTLHPGMAVLKLEAEREGFRFLVRLVEEWRSEENRFDREGESLLGAVRADKLVGICGLNRDPHTDDDRVGRLRHLYVSPAWRRRGVGSALVFDLLATADRTFSVVRLRTDSVAASAFYERLGFVRLVDATASHVRVLRYPR